MKSWVEISSARLVENLRAVQSVAAAGAGAGVETLAVIKANAYGHGADLVAPVLTGAGARWLGVSDVDEGARVRQALGQGSTRLLVMCGMELGDAPALVAHGITPAIWTVEHIAAMERAARAAGQRVKVHLEIDTGMARQGVGVDSHGSAELGRVLERLTASRWVACEGVLSHLASAEIAGAATTAAQRERFGAALEQVAHAGIRPELVHLGNSSAVDEGSTMGWVREQAKRVGARPMVRTGLALYGYCLEIEGAAGTQRNRLLASRVRPVLTWKTRVIGLREIAAGETVGYGATFTAAAPMRLALLPVGYADGFRRAASSGGPLPGEAARKNTADGVEDWVRGWVMIAGKRAAVVGRVSMNLTTVDVTAIPEAVVGGEVALLGEGATAADHARWSDTISYDILCGIRARFEPA